MERADWLEARKQYLTASDVAALCGLNSSKRASQVIKEKSGLVAAEELDEGLLAQVPAGRHLESGIAAWFLAETPHTEAIGNGNNLIVSPTVPYLAATPDFIVDGDPLEIKLAGETQLVNWYEAGVAMKNWPVHIEHPVPLSVRVRAPAEFLTVGVNDRSLKGNWRRSRQHQMQVLLPGFGEPRAPIKYWVQLQVQMHVLGRDTGWIVGCVGGTRRLDFMYERDVRFEGYMLGVAESAWAMVQAQKVGKAA